MPEAYPQDFKRPKSQLLFDLEILVTLSDKPKDLLVALFTKALKLLKIVRRKKINTSHLFF